VRAAERISEIHEMAETHSLDSEHRTICKSLVAQERVSMFADILTCFIVVVIVLGLMANYYQGVALVDEFRPTDGGQTLIERLKSKVQDQMIRSELLLGICGAALVSSMVYSRRAHRGITAMQHKLATIHSSYEERTSELATANVELFEARRVAEDTNQLKSGGRYQSTQERISGEHEPRDSNSLKRHPWLHEAS
jgi:hypothetical protein